MLFQKGRECFEKLADPNGRIALCFSTPFEIPGGRDSPLERVTNRLCEIIWWEVVVAVGLVEAGASVKD